MWGSHARSLCECPSLEVWYSSENNHSSLLYWGQCSTELNCAGQKQTSVFFTCGEHKVLLNKLHHFTSNSLWSCFYSDSLDNSDQKWSLQCACETTAHNQLAVVCKLTVCSVVHLGIPLHACLLTAAFMNSALIIPLQLAGDCMEACSAICYHAHTWNVERHISYTCSLYSLIT
jgi:hypothetical protein